MKPKDIRRSIRAAFKDASFATASTGPEIREAIQLGRDHDADALFIATLRGHDLQCGLVIGRSLLYGEDAMEYLTEYHDSDSSRVVAWIEQVANDAAHDLRANGETFFGLIKAEGDERWRGFRGDTPMTVDEVRASARSVAN